MIVKEIGFGNKFEAFVETRFQNKTNIVFSNDNNRGKTLLMQSLVYSIGYEAIFPSGFNYKYYYFYSKIEFNKKDIEFLRKGNSILVIKEQKLFVFNSVSEFKYYFNKEIYELPKIDKDGELKIVDLSLFYELFFLGQDKRNTSNIIVKGFNNKQDFLHMLFSLAGIAATPENPQDVEKLKREKQTVETRIKSETKKLEVLKSNPEIASFISSASNNIDFRNKSNQLNELHRSIAELKKQRNREENRKIKLENLILELNSLNRNLDQGKVKCGECGSDKIIFSNEEFEFEISNSFVRQNIIKSINENIKMKSDIVNELNNRIIGEQSDLNDILETTTPAEQDYILFKDEIASSKEVNEVILVLQNQLNLIEANLRNNKIKIILDRDAQSGLVENILKEMRNYYSKIDRLGLLTFDHIFTKSGETYSGSESQEYYFCKILALNKVLKHDFPILIDSFREGELSSFKEDLMIKEFIKLNKQVILTSTLKKEEYDSDKYFKIEGINVIDYSSFQDSRILQGIYVEKFNERINKFGIIESEN